MFVPALKQHPPFKRKYKKESGIVSANFSLEHCQSCAKKDNCPVKFQQNSAVLRVKVNAVIAAHARKRIFDKPLLKRGDQQACRS